MNRKLIFLLIFLFLNLSFIPLIAAYGLNICPVLTNLGFKFGCSYSSFYIFLLLVLNFLFVQITERAIIVQSHYRIILFFVSYLFASFAALVGLKALLTFNHISDGSRAPEVLILASVLLGITQIYGLSWSTPLMSNSTKQVDTSFQRLWGMQIIRSMTPIATATIVLLHFLLRQSFHYSETLTPASVDTLIRNTSLLVTFLLVWMVITYVFHFLSEKDQANLVQNHLKKLESSDLNHRSETINSFGLWKAILQNLNAFSKVISERGLLLKNFSRFVTNEVAQKALNIDLEASHGTLKEMTVIMTDIRNFTSTSETMKPDEVVGMLNSYFNQMISIMTTYQITVDKFIGDGILGYVDSQEISTTKEANKNAVMAAIAMLDALPLINSKINREIHIGIGIYRGPLVVGLIGSTGKLQHTIIGDTVNRSSRMEGLCKELGVPICISKEIYHSLDNDYQKKFKSFGLQSMKGIKEPVEIFGGPFL